MSGATQLARTVLVAPRAADFALNLREDGGGFGVQKVRGAAVAAGRRVALAVPSEFKKAGISTLDGGMGVWHLADRNAA